MPLISTRGGLSSRGFGQFGRTTIATLNTFTFPAGSSTFTVPATTNLLVSAVGAGANGSPGSTQTILASAAIVFPISQGPGGPGNVSVTYDELFALQNSVIAAANLGGIIYYQSRGVTVRSNNLCIVTTNDTDLGNVVAGTASALVFGSFPTSGPVTFANAPPGTSPGNLGVQYNKIETIPPSTGAATTGFGLTFPGGAGGASSTTTFNNVAVVPNQTYVIQNNKSLTITYFS